MPKCRAKRTRKRGLCQTDVPREGDRCKKHSEEAQQTRLKKAQAEVDPTPEIVTDHRRFQHPGTI